MSYNKHTWVNNVDAVDEDKMNHIENGIKDLDDNKENLDEKIILGTGGIDSNLTNINVENVDFSLYKAISIQLGNPGEGDSKVILISSDGSLLNDIVHLDNYANSSYYCKAYAYAVANNGTVGYISVIPKELVGWGYVSVQIAALKKR